jgi:hypothetical protein
MEFCNSKPRRSVTLRAGRGANNCRCARLSGLAGCEPALPGRERRLLSPDPGRICRSAYSQRHKPSRKATLQQPSIATGRSRTVTVLLAKPKSSPALPTFQPSPPSIVCACARAMQPIRLRVVVPNRARAHIGRRHPKRVRFLPSGRHGFPGARHRVVHPPYPGVHRQEIAAGPQ